MTVTYAQVHYGIFISAMLKDPMALKRVKVHLWGFQKVPHVPFRDGFCTRAVRCTETMVLELERDPRYLLTGLSS